jgi:AraC-like DNA-binding protein
MHAAEFVSSYIDAWNRQDAQAIADHLAENGTYLDIPLHQNMPREQLVAYLDEQFELETNRYELTGEVLTGENTIAFQYKVYPRQSGSEQEAIWFGAEFITLSNGAAIEIADYYEQRNEQPSGSPIANAAGARRVQRYAKSGLGTGQMEAVKSQLNELMEKDKIYLRPDLTLPELAEVLGCTVNHLSQAINAGFGVSFFDYINAQRVQDAMRLLSQESSAAGTVLDVALQVGFNSTSTFYVAFKKVTGKTPAQYRQQDASGNHETTHKPQT